jgi:hypothetical protein
MWIGNAVIAVLSRDTGRVRVARISGFLNSEPGRLYFTVPPAFSGGMGPVLTRAGSEGHDQKPGEGLATMAVIEGGEMARAIEGVSAHQEIGE